MILFYIIPCIICIIIALTIDHHSYDGVIIMTLAFAPVINIIVALLIIYYIISVRKHR